jgi:curved DNA-binding protein
MKYYETLGITKGATAAEIKSAYRKLAAIHHPDRGGNPDRMQTINEAYDTLKDTAKRSQYDNPRPQHSGGFHTSQDFEDVMQHFRSGNASFGNGFQQRQQRNKDITVKAEITIAEMISGKDIVASYRLGTGTIETVEISIPVGARSDMRIQYAGLGDDAHSTLPRGNLYVLIAVIGQANWHVRNNDLYTEHKVNVLDMMLGSKVEIETLEKKKVSLRIPAGTKAGTTFGLLDQGVPDVNSKKRGRLLIQIHPDIPQLNDAERAKLQELKDLMDT